ncbi:MAG: putative Ig domain-containing protein, partial [Bacteroidia bacterium]
YRLNVSEAWRLNSASSSAFFSISGGNTGSLSVPMTIVTDPSGQWSNSSGSAVITLNKSATPTTLRNTGCCKISTIMNNRDRSWDEYIVLRTDQPGSSPVSTLPAIINMPVNAPAATYTIPATDPDAGSTVTFGSPTFTGNLSGQTQPSGFAINATTGQITLNTVGKTIGQQYNALVTVTDNNGNQIMLDFLINMVGASTPPVFDYTVTPTNGAVYNVMAGQNLSFPVRATDGDAGSTVSMSVAGLPSYITTGNFSNAALPATGNPSQTNFSWTPSGAQIGTTNVLNFIATDNVGVQTTTSVTIRVVAEPAPVFIAPTALQNSFRQIETGQLFKDTIVAQSSIGSNVSIAFATGIPAAASLSPAVPTAGANPAQTILSWTPTPADFGVKTFGYQATVAAFPTIFTTRNFTIIVNTTPSFSSTPVTSVVAGQPYSYAVTVNDANIPYGDTVDILGAGLPAWLSLVSTGNGTATLSGTPTLADVGVYEIGLEAEDIYHHGTTAHVHQHFDLAVNAPASITAGGNTTFCEGSNVVLTANSGTGLTYQWKKDGNNITGATSISYSATTSGSYTAVVTGSGVSATSNAIGVTVNPSVVISNCPQTQYQQIYTDSNSCSTTFSYNPTIGGATDVTYTFTGATTANGNGTGSGSVFNIGQTTVTINASGICGTATCSFVVTVIDNKKPIALTKNVTIYLNANGTATVNANDINNGSSDNCGPVTVSLSQTGTICGTGTENQNVVLSAPAGAKITAINFASYGNPNGTCGNFTQGWCHAANSKSVVEGYALQTNSAVIPASNGIFGDPCFGTVKRLNVQATWTGVSATNTF